MTTQRNIKTKPQPFCPDCGAIMKLKRPKKYQDWPPFWGCGDWPHCDGSRKINFQTGEVEGMDDLWGNRSGEWVIE